LRGAPLPGRATWWSLQRRSRGLRMRIQPANGKLGTGLSEKAALEPFRKIGPISVREALGRGSATALAPSRWVERDRPRRATAPLGRIRSI
jgi:hypothetical protein